MVKKFSDRYWYFPGSSAVISMIIDIFRVLINVVLGIVVINVVLGIVVINEVFIILLGISKILIPFFFSLLFCIS